MHTRQVVAIYKKFKNKLDMPKKPYIGPLPEDPSYHQINMFEYMASLTQNNTEVNV